jgi:lysophospholipase L1-like esterase
MREGLAIAAMLLSVCIHGVHAEEAPIRLLPLGDSITHGYWSGIGTNTYNSYRKELKNLLDTNGFPSDFVGSLADGSFPDHQHEGHDGWHADEAATTNDILGRVAGWMADTDADIVLLHIGTNDILDNEANAMEVSNILDEIYGANSNASVVLALIINADPAQGTSADISTYNSNLNIMAQSRISAGEDLLVVDMENGAGLDYGSPDMIGMHPSPTGYIKMATNWYPAVVKAIGRQYAYRNGPPHIDLITATHSSISLELNNLTAGLPVHVEQTDSLTSAAWTNAGSFVPLGSTTQWINQTAPGHAAFYRLVIP